MPTMNLIQSGQLFSFLYLLLVLSDIALTHLILSLPTLPPNYTLLNSYSASSNPLAPGPKPLKDYTSHSTQRLLISWCPALGFWMAL